MKQCSFIYTIAIVLLAATALAVISCKDLITPPTFGQQNTTDTYQAVTNLKASQGAKSVITLTWTPVSNAVRYNIYAAATKHDAFEKVGSPSTAAFTYTAEQGVTRYFKVRAVSNTGAESDDSLIVEGTTLAQPVISDIETGTDNDENTVTVYWYMENHYAYYELLRYNITCMSGAAVVKTDTISGIDANGSIAETAYTFMNLAQNTNYTYTVEAYLISDQAKSEISKPVDELTAVSLRPSAPVNLKASHGISKDCISLSFQVPEKAYIRQTLSAGTSDEKTAYTQYPLYFKIERRIVAAADASENSWETLKQKMYILTGGELKAEDDAELAGLSGNLLKEKLDTAYVVGSIASFTDTSALVRGKQYEYRVRSYVYERGTTSEKSSVAVAKGWTLAVPALKITDFEKAVNEGKTLVNIKLAASLNLHGKEDSYQFIIEQKKYINFDGTLSPEQPQKKIYTTLSEIANPITYELDGTDTDTDIGYYAYTLHIMPKGESDTEKALDSVTTSRKIFITHKTDLPKAEITAIEDGYKDKAHITWTVEAGVTYTLERHEADKNGYAISTAEPVSPLDSGFVDDTVPEATGKIFVYTLYAEKNGITISSEPKTAYMLGKPSVIFNADTPAYDSIATEWNPVQKAERYKVVLKNSGSEIDSTMIEKSVDGNYIISSETMNTVFFNASTDTLAYTIIKPQGFNDAQISGKDFTLTVTAYSTNDNVESDMHLVRTLGPANTNTTVNSIPDSSSHITVTWDEVHGAAGYLVRRDRCDLTNTSILSSDIYFVPINPSGNAFELKANKEAISGATNAMQLGNKITLTDTYTQLPEENATTWQSNQDKIAWGYPYRYTVYPVKSVNDAYSFNSDSSSMTIEGIAYENTGKIYKTGATYGYGFDVTATKSTYTDKVVLSWIEPYGTVHPQFRLWRCPVEKNWTVAENWLATGYNGTTASCTVTDDLSNAYYYAITYDMDTRPQSTYIAHLMSKKDTASPTEPPNKGYALRLYCEVSQLSGYNESIDWKLWDYTKRAIGPAQNTLYSIQLKNSDYNAAWNEVCTVSQATGTISLANNSDYNITATIGINTITLTPVFHDDTHSGLLHVLRDYKHYVKLEYTNANGKKVQLSRDNLYSYREITAKEFALVSAMSLATAMYRDRANNTSQFLTYEKLSSWGTQRLFDFNKSNGPFFQIISGTLYAWVNTSGPEMPSYYGHWDGGWGDINDYSRPSTVVLTSSADIYSGSVTFTSMTESDGTYAVTYRSTKDENFRTVVAPLFSYKNLSSPENKTWSSTQGWIEK
ncbi:MAG: hypothetical protein J6I73_05125 [Treponema sp.]|nr:hypothetical protein [Treponema sp.]